MTRARPQSEIGSIDDAAVPLRTRLQWSIGLRARGDVDRALALIAREGPLLLLGPRGLDQAEIAHAIHRGSRRRRQPFVRIERPAAAGAALRAADGGTVFLDLTTAVTPALLCALLGWEGRSYRPVFAAPDAGHARGILGALADGPRIQLRGLSARGVDVPVLMDTLLVQASCTKRLAVLGPERIAGMARARWAGNLEALRAAVPRLAAFLQLGLRGGARQLGISHTTLDHSLLRMFDPDTLARRMIAAGRLITA